MIRRPVVYEYFKRSADILLAEFARSREQNASNNLGANREYFCNNFLIKNLPTKLSLGSGEIWDSNGTKTGQLDSIIFREDAPKLSFGEREAYLAEGVFSVIEVKSNLIRQKLIESGKSLERVKNLNIKGGTVISSGPLINRPLRIVFSYEGATINTLLDEIKNRNWFDLFDLICILKRGVLVSKGLLITFDEKFSFSHINGSAAALGILYLYLISYSCSFLGRSLNINDNFEPFNNWGD